MGPSVAWGCFTQELLGRVGGGLRRVLFAELLVGFCEGGLELMGGGAALGVAVQRGDEGLREREGNVARIAAAGPSRSRRRRRAACR